MSELNCCKKGGLRNVTTLQGRWFKMGIGGYHEIEQGGGREDADVLHRRDRPLSPKFLSRRAVDRSPVVSCLCHSCEYDKLRDIKLTLPLQ